MEKVEDIQKNDLSGASITDEKYFGMWNEWYACCFNKNGEYLEEKDKIFQEFLERQENNKKTTKVPSKNAPKNELELEQERSL